MELIQKDFLPLSVGRPKRLDKTRIEQTRENTKNYRRRMINDGYLEIKIWLPKEIVLRIDQERKQFTRGRHIETQLNKSFK